MCRYFAHVVWYICQYKTVILTFSKYFFMLSLIETRNRHFMAVCRSIVRNLPKGERVDLAQVAMRAAKSEAPHYYCTYAYALRMLRVLRHGCLTLKRDRRYRQWEELNGKCERLMARRGCKLPEALCHVLASERASEFFIAPATALKLAQRMWGK